MLGIVLRQDRCFVHFRGVWTLSKMSNLSDICRIVYRILVLGIKCVPV